MKSKMNHSNAFVLEILLDILLFSILLTVALNMLIKAHHLTNQTKELHNAVSIARIVKSISSSPCAALTNATSNCDGAT